jgi:hypothetical protein
MGTNLTGCHLRELEEKTRSQIRPATFAPDRHPLAGQVVEGRDVTATEQMYLLVVEREDHPGLLGDLLENGI